MLYAHKGRIETRHMQDCGDTHSGKIATIPCLQLFTITAGGVFKVDVEISLVAIEKSLV